VNFFTFFHCSKPDGSQNKGLASNGLVNDRIMVRNHYRTDGLVLRTDVIGSFVGSACRRRSFRGLELDILQVGISRK
jgi:hypothetical protein